MWHGCPGNTRGCAPQDSFSVQLRLYCTHRKRPDKMAINNRTSRARWVFTLNNPTNEEEESLKRMHGEHNMKWFICQREQGAQGTPHLQGALVFRGQKRLSWLRRRYPRAHWEPMRGSPLQSKVYCSKCCDTCHENGRVHEADNDCDNTKRLAGTSVQTFGYFRHSTHLLYRTMGIRELPKRQKQLSQLYGLL